MHIIRFLNVYYRHIVKMTGDHNAQEWKLIYMSNLWRCENGLNKVGIHWMCLITSLPTKQLRQW